MIDPDKFENMISGSSFEIVKGQVPTSGDIEGLLKQMSRHGNGHVDYSDFRDSIASMPVIKRLVRTLVDTKKFKAGDKSAGNSKSGMDGGYLDAKGALDIDCILVKTAGEELRGPVTVVDKECSKPGETDQLLDLKDSTAPKNLKLENGSDETDGKLAEGTVPKTLKKKSFFQKLCCCISS